MYELKHRIYNDGADYKKEICVYTYVHIYVCVWIMEPMIRPFLNNL